MIKLNDRKHHVLLVAKKLFIENGFDATSIQDILNESKISKGTFYNYFASKNECLFAILDIGRNETAIRRKELLIGEDKADASLLAEQISIRFQVNHEHNLIPIFEAIFHSGDAELRGFAEEKHLAELLWLSHRLIDVYGEEVKSHAVDCSIMLIGMLQHMIHLWTKTQPHEKVPKELVSFTVQQIDSIMPKMVANKKSFFNDSIFGTEINADSNNQVTKKQLLLQLDDFYRRLEDLSDSESKKQYILFLLEELEKNQPRFYLIESVVKSFRKDFIDTSKEKEVQQLVGQILCYMENIME